MIFARFLAGIFANYVILCQVLSDEIKSLPGLYVNPTFKQYSGYLTGAPNIRLYYWFVESQSNASVDSVVLWLNGPPGCSSLLGYFTGNGPLLVTPDLQLKPNDYSWNKIANMLYLESPVGTGYSYATDGNISTSDSDTAYNNHLALLDFFNKYPKFRSNEFYITGEGYATHLVLCLSKQLIEDNQINFKGMMIDSGICNEPFNTDSFLYFMKYRGMINERIWQESLDKCCPNTTDTMCYFHSSAAEACKNLIAKMKNGVYELDPLNIYKPIKHDLFKRKNITKSFLLSNRVLETIKEMLRYRENSIHLMYAYVDRISLTKYMNLPLLQKSIGMNISFINWTLCSRRIKYHYKEKYKTMANIYKDVINQQKYRVWIYAGDFNVLCNYIGQKWFLDSLGYPVEKNYTRWTYIGQFNQPQLGGFYIRYFPNITYATICGAGYMVPTDKPLPAFVLFQAFLQNAHL